MMMDKRLIGTVKDSKKYIALNVLCKWLGLIANILLMATVASVLALAASGGVNGAEILRALPVFILSAAFKMLCALLSSKMSYLSSKAVKGVLREKIYAKLLRLGGGYRQSVHTSEVVQVAVEGVEQLETYFGAYLPQFFYAMLAPLTLFSVLAPVDFPSALALLLLVPLIPVSIAAVQTWAKKLLGRYWKNYTALGSSFLENLEGLTTLKIYRADAFKHEEMNREAERFRRVTMKVLTMQLNSITIMDIVAFGGAALGIIIAASRFRAGLLPLQGALTVLLLSADFFLPMRALGSFFHIAMNGMAASGKIFRLLDIEEKSPSQEPCREGVIALKNVDFSYEKDREVLHDVSLELHPGEFVAVVGASGSGKSTVAGLLMGRNTGYGGSVSIAGTEIKDIAEADLMRHLTYVGHNSYLFRGTVKDNLMAARPDADEKQLWEALRRARLEDFLLSEKGLDTSLTERGGNLSGGQRQRLALARALLHDSPVYIFDEATSNIDADSENHIMAEINELAKSKTVLLISHRLLNAAQADRIYVMENGRVAESGGHEELLSQNGLYARLWNTQQQLETYGKEA